MLFNKAAQLMMVTASLPPVTGFIVEPTAELHWELGPAFGKRGG